MKKNIICFAFILFSVGVIGKENVVTTKGKKVFVESNSKNDNAIKTADELVLRLNEWGYWKVTKSASEADFKINIETVVSKGISMTSWGGNSYALTAKIMDKKGAVLWESNTYKSSPNGTNGFNSSTAVVKKLIRDLKKKYKD